MSAGTLLLQIKSLEKQLSGLKTRVERVVSAKPVRTFADLEGILAVTPGFSEEEIDTARYRVKEPAEE